MPKISVIVPSRTRSNVLPCLEAVKKNDPECRRIVIDDGIESGPEQEFGLYNTVVIGTKPFVFARNCNLGIATTFDEDVVLLNDDALLRTEGGFTAMQKALAANPEYGLLAATSNNVGNVNQWPIPMTARTGPAEIRFEPRMVCFICVMIPRRTIELVGLLDQRFTAYGFEDDDYCLRVRQAGLKIGIFDGCYVDHGSLKSTFRGNPQMSTDLTPGREIFRQKWGKLT